jgi:hypothetical protein
MELQVVIGIGDLYIDNTRTGIDATCEPCPFVFGERGCGMNEELSWGLIIVLVSVFLYDHSRKFSAAVVSR